MATPTNDFIRHLTKSNRVIVLGGLAVIAHGYSRSTYDGDIWLDPKANERDWAGALAQTLRNFKNLTAHRLPGWVEVPYDDLSQAIGESRVVRILGLDCPLDIFRDPNQIDLQSFNSIYERGTRQADGTVLPHPLDLIHSKLDTGREKDQQDILFLEPLVRAEYKERLPRATLDDATEMLSRFSDWQVLQYALENPSEDVRALATQHLHEFAEAGDPFSLAILEGREIP